MDKQEFEEINAFGTGSPNEAFVQAILWHLEQVHVQPQPWRISLV